MSRDWQDFSEPFAGSTYTSPSQDHWTILASIVVPRKYIQPLDEEMIQFAVCASHNFEEISYYRGSIPEETRNESEGVPVSLGNELPILLT